MKNARLPLKITNFRGDWFCFSNFYPVTVTFDDVKYGYVETAYVAAKTLDLEARRVLSLEFNPRLSAGQGKRIGKGFKERGLLRPDWHEVNVDIMRSLLIQKFSYSILKRKLLSSFTAELVEENTWHDIFWGVCVGQRDGIVCQKGLHEPIGENWLGRLLMEVRTSIVAGTFTPQLGLEPQRRPQAPPPVASVEPLSSSPLPPVEPVSEPTSQQSSPEPSGSLFLPFD